MKLRKLLVATIAASFLFSCSQDQLKEQSEGDTANLSVSSLYDYSNLGTYKGVFTTNDSQMRGVIEINSLDNDFAKATLTTNDGQIATAISAQKVLDGVGVNDLVFNSTAVNGISFKYSISADGSAPLVSDVMYKNAPSSITIAKETSKGPVVPVTGNYLKDGTSAGDTFSVIFSGDGTGDDAAVTTQIMRLGMDIGTATNTQSGCADGTTFTTCTISGTSMTVGGATITWTGTHQYGIDPLDCSIIAGTWTSTGPFGATGTFTSDPTACALPGDTPMTAIAITPNVEGTGCADGVGDQTVDLSAAGGFTDSGATTACANNTRDVWYSWTSTTDGLTFFAENGLSTTNPGVSAFTADGMTELSCGDGSFGSIALDGWTIGDDILIRITSNIEIPFCLEEFSIPAIPANDLCDDAEAINCGDTIMGNTVTATNSDATRGNDVWYSLDGAANTGSITLSLCGSTYDTHLEVFDACAGAFVVNNDDFCGGQSQLTFTSDGATNYIVRVDGFSAGDAGAFTLNVSCAEPGPEAPVSEEEVIHPAKLAAMNEK